MHLLRRFRPPSAGLPPTRLLILATVLLTFGLLGIALLRSRPARSIPSPPPSGAPVGSSVLPLPSPPESDETPSEEEVPTWRKKNLDEVTRLYECDQAEARRNSDLFVRRGLRADRKRRQVCIYAEATALDPRAELEFFLIPEQSGHDYEALAVSFAQPSDIHEALVFIGLPPGRPIAPRQHAYWPKGERVHMLFQWTPPSIAGEPVGPLEVHAEQLLFDTVLRRTLPVQGFVFTGSRFVPHPQDPARLVYAADLFGPNSIASAYNDPDTVLDVPHQAGKSAMYGRQFANADFRFERGQFLTILLEPEYPPERRRVHDLTMRVGPSARPDAPPALSFESPEGKPLLTDAGPEAARTFLKTVAESGQDAFVRFLPDPELSLDQVRLVCAWLDLMEQAGLLRVEPPPTGHPYYRAFLPEERFRDRRNWIVKPRELRLSPAESAAGALRAQLTLLTEEWEEGREEPILSVTEEPIESPDALGKRLVQLSRDSSVMLIMAPAFLRLGDLLPFLAVAEPTHPILWVFLDPPSSHSLPEARP